jgi:hypothetical protein
MSNYKPLPDHQKGTIVILNCPPGSGKDEIANGLNFVHLRFKQIIIMTALMLCYEVTSEEWNKRYADRELKETPWDKIGGMTQRELLIMVSEDVIKKIHGQGYIGAKLAEQVMPKNNYVISDGGFREELDLFVEGVKETHDVFIFNVSRLGCSFDKDSRDYVYFTEGAVTLPLVNYEDNIMIARKTIMALVGGSI